MTVLSHCMLLGTVSMVKSGQIEAARAIKLFEGMREMVLNCIYASEGATKDKGI